MRYKALSSTAALLATISLGSLFVATEASAVTINDDTAVGTSFTINYDGKTDTGTKAGLTASTTFTLAGYDIVDGNSVYEFNYNVTNTSDSPVTSSRITALGFNTDPDPNPDGSSVDGVFGTISSGAFSNFGKVEICTSTGQNSCSGGGGTGITIGESEGGLFSLAFLGTVESFTFTDFAVRYQTVNCPTCKADDSGTGIGTPGTTPVPGPIAGAGLPAMFALGGLVWANRRRKAAATT